MPKFPNDKNTVFFRLPIVVNPAPLVDMNDLPSNWTVESAKKFNADHKNDMAKIGYKLGYNCKGIVPRGYEKISRETFMRARRVLNNIVSGEI